MEHLDWDVQANAVCAARQADLDGAAGAALLERLRALFPLEDRPLRILDAGTGTGYMALLLAQLGHSVVGVDTSAVMIQCAYETAAARGLRVEFRIADCRKLPFADESFDGVVSCDTVHCLADPPGAYGEWYRVLRRGGLLAVVDRERGEERSLSDTAARPRRDVEMLRELGFAHCRADASAPDGSFWVTAHKSSSAGRMHSPQMTQYNRLLRSAKEQLQIYNSWCAANGLSYTEFMVLHMASHHVKGLRPSDISAALVIPRQTLTRVLAELERRGDVERLVNESDRRSALIRITPAGRTRFETMHRRLHDREQRALDGFSVEELSRFADFSEALLAAYTEAFRQEK